MVFGKEKEKLKMLERIADSLSRSIDDLTAEVNVMRSELEDIKKRIRAPEKKVLKKAVKKKRKKKRKC